jgi:hypothetical protein
MGTLVSFVSVRRTGRLLAVLTLVMALVVFLLAPMASAQTTDQCTDNLLLNPSFETGTGSNNTYWGEPIPADWTHEGSGFTGATTLYSPPDGTRIGYVIHTSADAAAAIMYQQVAVVGGDTYNMTFYSGTHDPSKEPTIAIRFYNGSTEIGTPAIHTITKDIDNSTLDGPYTLTGIAPADATSLRVIFTDPGSTVTPFVYAGAKGDSLCLTRVPPTAVSLAGFSAQGGNALWGGVALLGVVLAGLAVSQRRLQH